MSLRNSLQLFVPQSQDTQIFSQKYPVMRKVYTGYHGISQIEHSLSACTVDNTRAFSVQAYKPCSISHVPQPQIPIFSTRYSLKLGDYLSVDAHKPCSISHIFGAHPAKVCLIKFAWSFCYLTKSCLSERACKQNHHRDYTCMFCFYLFL